jgi:hypothetical protein
LFSFFVIKRINIFKKFIKYFSILDIELHYSSKGEMISPPLGAAPGIGVPCNYTWENGDYTDASREKLQNFLRGIAFSVRVTISALTGQ